MKRNGKEPGRYVRMGNKLREYRERLDLSQVEVSNLAGVKRSYLSSAELGRIGIIYPDIFESLHRVLRFPGWELLEAMGYKTDVPTEGIEPGLSQLIRSVPREQQAALTTLVRAMMRTDSQLAGANQES